MLTTRYLEYMKNYILILTFISTLLIGCNQSNQFGITSLSLDLGINFAISDRTFAEQSEELKKLVKAVYNLDFPKDFFSSDEFLVVVFAILIDLVLFLLIIPPPLFSSWSEYFSDWDYSEYDELSKYFQLLIYFEATKNNEGNFYIPVNKSHLIPLLLPLIAKDLVVFKGKIPRWKEFFTVPRHIRIYEKNTDEKGTDEKDADRKSPGFYHYKVNFLIKRIPYCAEAYKSL